MQQNLLLSIRRAYIYVLAETTTDLYQYNDVSGYCLKAYIEHSFAKNRNLTIK